MPKYFVRGSTASVDLNDGTLKAQGGEGAIHIVGNVVYKVCFPGKTIPDGKFTELNALNHPRIVKPEAVLLDAQKQPCGYTMNLVPGHAIPLAQILSKTFREREGVTPDMMAKLVQQIADGIRFIHAKPGYLQVDGNEFNYMVTEKYDEVYFIDVNSYQTPHYPADALMQSVRDFHCPKDPKTGLYVWSHDTDWFSAAVIFFYMFTGIHPFKGRHPKFTNLKTAMIDQMKASVSVLNPDVQFPQAAVYFPFESVIPGGKDGAFMQWFKALFVDNKRFPAPKDFQSAISFVAAIKEIVGSNNFDINEIREYVGQVVGYYAKGGKEIIVSTDNVYVANQGGVRPANKFRVGFTPILNTPVAVWLDGNHVKLQNLESKASIPCDIQGKDLMVCDGRIYIQSENNILEMDFIEGANIISASKPVASIMPNATQLFQGVAIQDMFGKKMASIFPQSRHHRAVMLEELSSINVTDAKYEHNVLMVVGLDPKTSQYNRYIFRFSKTWDSYDLRVIDNINPNGLNFTVLDNGTCISITEEEKVEIFSSLKDAVGVKSIADPAVKANMRLCHNGAQVRFAHGNKIYSFSIRK